MRFGETASDLYATSFGLGPDYECPAWPYDETIKILEAEDGSVIEVVNFGAREERRCDFTLVQMSRTEFYALSAFCEANKGLRIRVEFESDAERVFGQQSPYNGPAIYAYLIAHTPLGESGFTAGHELYSYSMTLDWAGLSATSVPNALESSDIDVLIDVDCVQAYPGCTVANLAALTAVTPAPPDGSKGVTRDTLKVYIMTRESGSPTWRFIYSLPSNNPDLGLVDGIFHWSEFADLSSSAPGIGGIAYKSGIIRAKSVRLSRYSAGHVRNKPGIERLEGFKFSIKMQERTHLYPLENNISFYEAKVSVSFYFRGIGVRKLVRTGVNNKNSFDYSDYEFEVEPRAFGGNAGFPSRVYDSVNFPNHATSMEGEPIIQTYGRWQVGELQAATWTTREVRWPSGRRSLGFVAYVPETRVLTLDIVSSDVLTVLKLAALADYAAQVGTAGGKLLYVKIEEQDDQPEKGVLKKVTAIAASGANLALTLSEGFAVPPTTAARLLIHLSITDLVISDRPCIGMRAPGYLRGAAGLQVFGAPDKAESEGEDYELFPVPSKIFKVVGSDENRLAVDSDYLSLQSDGNFTSLTEHNLPLDPLYHLHQRIDKISGGPVPYRYFDFGLTLEGEPSSEVEVTPVASVTSIGMTSGFVTVGQGQVRAAFSPTSVRLIWTPWPDATGFKIQRCIVVTVTTPMPSGPNGKLSNNATSRLRKLDTTFGTSGSVTVSGATYTYVDSTPPATNPGVEFEYWVTPIIAGQNLFRGVSNIGRIQPAPSAAPTLYAVSRDSGILVAWVPPVSQARVVVELDSGSGFNAAPGMPILSSTQDTHLITGLANNTRYKVRIKVGTIVSGATGDVWYISPSTEADWAVWQLKTGSNDGSTDVNFISLHAARSSVQHPALYAAARQVAQDWTAYVLAFEYAIKNRPANQGVGLPAFSTVAAWSYRVDHDELARQMGGATAMSGAKDVRLLINMVVRCFSGDNTPENVTIQLWGIKKDGTKLILGKHSDLQTRAATESGSYGAYARFLNLPSSMGGRDADTDYKNEETGSNADGLYTGKNLWRLPDHLFEDDAYEWCQIETLVFAITHSQPIAEAKVRPTAKGLRLGFGGQSGQTWEMIRDHKGELHLEVLREFSGGVKKPQYARIDGGIKDLDGSVTGTAGKPIEKALDIIDDVCQSMLGYKPKRIGSELASRANWLWRYRAKPKKTSTQILELFARNIHGFFTITEDDEVCLRSLDVDDGGAVPVFDVDASKNIAGGIGMPEIRPRNEIFQSFKLMYNLNVVTGKCDEEMSIGWDMARGVPIQRGYRNVSLNSQGRVEAVGSLDNLDLMCQVSHLLHAPSGRGNDYGVESPEEYEMFYRPTAVDQVTLEKVEATLPNLEQVWGSACFTPKHSMRALMQKVVKHKFVSAWYFSVKWPLSYLIYNASINGVSDAAGTQCRYIQIGDVGYFSDYHHTKNQKIKCKILDIDPSTWYDSFITVWLFAPRPPGQLGWLIDPEWDASGPGLRRNEDYLFEGNLYGLLDEEGTAVDAGAPGPRDNSEYTFPDGTDADAQGFGSGKA